MKNHECAKNQHRWITEKGQNYLDFARAAVGNDTII